MILVLGSNDDPHLQRVAGHLESKGVPYSVLCAKDFPTSDVGSIRFHRGEHSGSYRTRSSEIRLSDISAVWYRRLFPPVLDSRISDPEAVRFGMGEARAFLRGLWSILSDRAWVNPYYRIEAAESKPYQLAVAQKVGLTIPNTLITNDLTKVKAFFDETDAKVIYKPLSSFATAASMADGNVVPSQCVYTNVIERESLDQLGSQVALAPCIFQEYVPKDVELRITVIGNSFFSAAIHSQESKSSKIDWRKYDLENTPYTAFELPLDSKLKIRALLDELGLVYGAVDCILRPDGETVFLEVNPGGQWMWIEELTGLKIGQGIADHLIALTQRLD
jgi:glutathione synthase/RimK-type ligase-like ATP-grasp enzyme